MDTLLFRSSPRIELKTLAELAADERERFLELESDPEFYGLFVPKPPLAMNLKSVSREAAELFQSLATPRALDVDDDVVDLVLDGILEVESGGGFVSGADALAVVHPEVRARDVGRLSLGALLYAQDLETTDPRALTAALYLYNRIPMTPFWKSTFADVLEHVGATRGSLRALLEREWVAGDPARTQGWLSWSSRTRTGRGEDDVTFKLYVSPRPERIRDAFETLVRVLAGFPGTPFKIGSEAAGLLRPDKLVAYFRTREELDEVAAEVRRELAGCDAHGIPFTAPIDESGLLSWGVDPPESEHALKWAGARSWRLWVAQRLAAALAIAKQTSNNPSSAFGTFSPHEGRRLSRGSVPSRPFSPRGGEKVPKADEGRLSPEVNAIAPYVFAVERVRRQGVDVDTWTPAATLWSASR